MTLEEKRLKMQTLCSEWESSGQPQESFCQAHKIKRSTFAYWRNKYLNKENESGAKSFIALEPPLSMIEIRYPNGVTVAVPPEIASHQLRRLIYLS